MFYIISVLLRIVGFDRDDDPHIHGVSIFALASAQVDFFIKECAETVSIFRHSKDPVFLDYEDYDPRRTVETIFPSRRAPHQYKKVRVDNNPVIDFDLTPNKLYWTDAQRVVEATLMALSRVDGPIIVETGDDGSVVGVQKESVEGLLADMVHCAPTRSHTADCLQGRSRETRSRDSSPTLCTDEESCGRELTEWCPVMLSSAEMKAIRSDLLDFSV
jgi:hypothetical protein